MDDALSRTNGTPEITRAPTRSDLVRIARELHRLEARYLVVGGFAVIEHGFPRTTMNLDLLIETTVENEKRIFERLSILADKASLQLRPGEVDHYVVVRVSDEIVVDLLKEGCGIHYNEASLDAFVLRIEDVDVPFASASTLLKMKQTHRDKDQQDRIFLSGLLQQAGNFPEPSRNPSWMEKFLTKLWHRPKG